MPTRIALNPIKHDQERRREVEKPDQCRHDAADGEARRGDDGVMTGVRAAIMPPARTPAAFMARKARQRHIGDLRRRRMQRTQRDHEIGVEPTAHDRGQDEKCEVQQDRWRDQNPQTGVLDNIGAALWLRNMACSLAARGSAASGTAGSGCVIKAANTINPKIDAPI